MFKTFSLIVRSNSVFFFYLRLNRSKGGGNRFSVTALPVAHCLFQKSTDTVIWEEEANPLRPSHFSLQVH